MAIIDQLNEDLKTAMKQRDKFRLSVIRMLKGSLQKEQIDKGRDLTEDEELAVLSREHKQRKDSAEEFRKDGREDLAEQSEKELEIVEGYMPRQLSEDEITDKVREVIQETGAASMKDFGKVMGASVKAMKGQAEGSTIQKIARQLLSE